MNIENVQSRRVPAVLWILIPGVVGFAAGFFGPLVFNPEANQGPLLGIFITGPAGFFLGLLLLAIFRILRVSRSQERTVLAAACAILAAGTLYACMPSPKLQGTAVDARVLSCEPSPEGADAAIEYWEKRVAGVTWASPRLNWQDDARRRLRDDESVILSVSVLRTNRLYERQKPWDKGKIMATGWQTSDEQKSYYAQYAGGTCADYPVGTRSVQFVPYDLSGMNRPAADWPPSKLSDFLDLQVIAPIPDEYQKLIGN
jgi:hypothetical protein